MRTILLCLGYLLALIVAIPAHALVNFESGQLEINGILLLQDAKDTKRYYYLPKAPRIADTAEGEPEVYAVKFVDPKGESSGGLFHAMVTLTLPEAEITLLQKTLKESDSDAVIAGPVPLHEGDESGFTVVSGVMTDDKMTQSLISSGHAPVTPGSKAAIATSLTPLGATLLWDSLENPTSDVSISVAAYYEATLPSFEAKITADISTVYTHYSKLDNNQGGYKRRQIRDIADKLIRTGDIKVDVLNRLPENTADAAMQSMVDLITNKLTEAIFDHKTGFTALPEKETAVEQGQIKGRQSQGWLTKLFKGSGNKKYVTDDQFVLKKREDINQAIFRINLTRRAVIKVPFYTSGNLGGLFTTPERKQQLLKVINLADPAFQKRDIYFRIDAGYAKAFEKYLNYASINIRKKYRNGDTSTGEIIFTREDIRDGKFSKFWRYARLGEKGSKWLDYEYQIDWGSRDRDTERHAAPEWQKSNAPITALVPPVQRTDLEIDADRFLFEDAGIRTASIELKYHVFGKQVTERLKTLRSTDPESMQTETLYHDENTAIEYRVSWYDRAGKAIKGEWIPVESTFLVLTPPELH